MSEVLYREYNGVTRRRVARKPHFCEPCGRWVPIGDAYLEHTAFPGHEWVTTKVPTRTAECARCAHRYGRDFEVGTEQAYRDGLV